jgi:hypothetical protein
MTWAALLQLWQLSTPCVTPRPAVRFPCCPHCPSRAGFTNEVTKAFQQAAHVATEAMAASRTVAAYNLQPLLAAQFEVSDVP